jgi:hypothetical protein
MFFGFWLMFWEGTKGLEFGVKVNSKRSQGNKASKAKQSRNRPKDESKRAPHAKRGEGSESEK